MSVGTAMTDAIKSFWWLMLLRGIMMAIFGVIILVWPGLAVLAFVFVFGIYALIDGVAGFAHMIRVKEWSFLTTLMSVASLAAGVIALIWPAATAVVLLFIIAFWALIIGVLEFLGGIGLRKVAGSGWGWVVFSGIATIVLGIILLTNPLGGAVAMAVFVGIFTILAGLLLVLSSFALRGAFKHLAG